MPIALGDRIPSLTLQRMTPEGVRPISTDEFFAGRRIALFAVPGAFTPTCSDAHLPGFLVRADELRARGVDAIACTAVNDAHVLDAWSRATSSGATITMLADGSGDLARALDLVLDGRTFGMGLRSRRYAMVVDDGVVTYLGVEDGREVGVSSADAVLAALA
ncbi:MAG: peroxiredoxin [Acidobacteriota bacterium]|nr:peroxiredoxin [Acidobacteriota bacterium]MDH3523686.1 peroxiredoxin [Acidobacteriota bacterium]